jgi:molecular chaperone GrpE
MNMTETDPEQTLAEEQEGVEVGDRERQDKGTPQVEAVVEGEVETEGPEVEEEIDEVTALQQQLTEAQAKVDEYLDGWQRSRAEFANYRRREELRRKQMHLDIKSRLMLNLLPVLDDLDRAFDAMPEEARDSSWVQGLSLVDQKLQGVLQRDGLSAIEVEPGDAFDPNYHEAIMHEPSEQFESGQIVQVAQQGYKLDGMVLRPALVSVSSGKPDANG